MNTSLENSSGGGAELSIDQVVATLKQIIAEDLSLSIDIKDIDENVPLIEEGLALDSIVLVQMIGIIEDRLGFEFQDSDLRMRSFENLRTLADVAVKRRQQSNNQHR